MGVLDIGSNSVHMLIVDAHHGGAPVPAMSHKDTMKLSEQILADGNIHSGTAERLTRFVVEAREVAEEAGCTNLVAFATSAIREAPNGPATLEAICQESGVELQVLSGHDEARLTFLAVRRWFGWSAGRILMLDIGGGSLEIAIGDDEDPDVALSLPLGAGRLTRDLLAGDPPSAEEIKHARKYVRATIAEVVRDVAKGGKADVVVGSSKTFRSLARLCGAAPSGDGPLVPRALKRADLAGKIAEITPMTAAQRAELPGVSEARAHQLLAGALVAEGAMSLFSAEKIRICPWALREGNILLRLDLMSAEFGLSPANRLLG